MLVDLHVHASPPCDPARGLAPASALAEAARLGLDGVALLGDDALADASALRTPDAPVAVFAGAEVSTDRGHYLVFFPQPSLIPSLEAIFGPREAGVWAARDVVARTNALGGAVVAAHPYERALANPAGDVVYTLKGLAALEAVNARHPDGFRAAIEAADVLGLPCTGGSDARAADGEVGRAATLFPGTFSDEAGLVAALHAGRCRPVEFGEPPPQLSSHPAPSPRVHEGPAREGERSGGEGGRRRGGRRRR